MKRGLPPKRKTPLKRSRLKAGELPSLKRLPGSSFSAAKPRKPIKARSAKTEEAYKARRPLVERLLRERPWCEACPVWAAADGKVTYNRRPSVDCHEILSRGRGGDILDEVGILCVCRPCHRRIDEFPAQAKELGLLRSAWDPSDGPVEP